MDMSAGSGPIAGMEFIHLAIFSRAMWKPQFAVHELVVGNSKRLSARQRSVVASSSRNLDWLRDRELFANVYDPSFRSDGAYNPAKSPGNVPHRKASLLMAEFLSLSALAAQPIETRCESLLRSCGDTLSSAVLALHRLNVPAFSNLDSERIAWAIAYNINPPSAVPLEADVPAHRCSSYRDHFLPETPWSVIWSKLVRVQNENNDASTLLRELLLSVACEQRQSWQPPGAVPLDRESANLALEFVYTNNKARVVGAVWRNFGARVGDPNAIADEAWSRVFCDYWSSEARRRFLGLSRISTLVSQVARFVGIDILRDDDDRDDREHDFDYVIENLGIESGLDNELAAKELRSRIDLCMQELAAKQRIVAEMLWFKELSARQTARALGISEAAVSQHVAKARDRLRNCLEKYGFRVAGYGRGPMIQ